MTCMLLDMPEDHRVLAIELGHQSHSLGCSLSLQSGASTTPLLATADHRHHQLLLSDIVEAVRKAGKRQAGRQCCPHTTPNKEWNGKLVQQCMFCI